MQTVDTNRLKIWKALSAFFLDTEIDDATFDYVARVVLETGYSPLEVQSILWREVFPVLEGNLRSVAGEWAGWSDDWLSEHIKVHEIAAPAPGNNDIAREIIRCWGRVALRLPPSMPENQ